MFLLVLRLLTVYFGTAAGILWLAHRFVTPLRLRVGIFLALGPFLLVGKALLTAGVYAPLDIAYQAPPLSVHAAEMGIHGTRTPILGDVVSEMIPYRKAVREAFKNGRLPLWNRFLLAGGPLLAGQQPAVLHPATWIGMLLPLAQAWTFEMALRILLALLCAYLFLRELGCGEVASLLGAVGWAFCDYLVFFAGWAHAAAAPPFPLLLLGLRWLVRVGGRRAVVLTVVALLLIITAGHPETLLHSVAGAGLYFLFELARAKPGRRLKAVLLSLLAGALALGLSAVLLLPLAEVLPWTIEQFVRKNIYAFSDRAYPVRESLLHTVTNLTPYLFGISGKGETPPGFHEPSGYVGSVLWPFAVVGLLFSKRHEKWPLSLLVVLGVAANARVPGFANALASLPFFDIGLNDRMVFLAAFGTSALAALGAQEVIEERRRPGVAAASAAGLLLLAALIWSLRGHVPWSSMSHAYFGYRVLLQALPLALLAALAWPRRIVWGGFLASSALLLLLAQRRFEEGNYYPTFPNRAFYPPLAVFEKIPRTLPYRFMAIGFSFVPNIAALYELEDVRGYEAITFKPLVETFPLWCVAQPFWFNRVDDPTRPFLSFLNVRYVYEPPGSAHPPGWTVLHSGADGVLLENPGAFPRAFAPRSIAYEMDPTRRINLLEGITDFAERGVIGQTLPAGSLPGAWQPNGEATVVVSSYRPQNMTLEINAKQAAFVATSVTAWPGWKLAVDGAKAALVPYNHAFLAFRISAGQHTAVLRYRPDGFVRGSAVSAVTLLLCAVLLLHAGRATSR